MRLDYKSTTLVMAETLDDLEQARKRGRIFV